MNIETLTHLNQLIDKLQWFDGGSFTRQQILQRAGWINPGLEKILAKELGNVTELGLWEALQLLKDVGPRHNIKGLRTVTLKNGAKIASISGHSFTFSDGSILEAQPQELVQQFNMERKTKEVKKVKGMAIYSQNMELSQYQLNALDYIAGQVDLVIIPVMVLDALRFIGDRAANQHPKLVAFNATKETQRSAPADKIVDIDNWSY